MRKKFPVKKRQMNFQDVQRSKKKMKVIQTFTFLCLAVAVICGMINYLMLETLNWFWFAAAGCLCAWLIVSGVYQTQKYPQK